MAGLGQYAGSFAAGFGQGMDDWREEDKKLSKQHQEDARFKQWEIEKANDAEDRNTKLRTQEHDLFKKELEERLSKHKFLKQPGMTPEQIRGIAANTEEYLSNLYPQLDFTKVRETYDYKGRREQRALNWQTKATAATRLIENTITENPSKYSQQGEIKKLLADVGRQNGFDSNVQLISDERVRQLIAAAVKTEASRKAENQLKRQTDLRGQLEGQALFWDEAAMAAPEGPAWQAAREALARLGITNPVEQGVYLESFNPTGMKSEAEAKWMSDKSTQISNAAKQYGTAKELIVGVGGSGYKLSQQTIDWINSQIQVNAPAREQNRDNFIINQMARKFANPRTVYHNVMGGDTKEFDAWVEELNNAKSTWGEISKEDILQIIYINQFTALRAELGADYAKLGNPYDQDRTPDMVSIVKSEGASQQLNELQQELLYSVINFDLINDKKSVSALAEHIRKNNILADTTQPVNMLKQAEQLMAQVRADPNSAITIARTREEEHKIKEEKRIKTATDFLADPGGHISNFEDDINGDSEKPMFGGIQANLDNLAKQSKQGDWSIGWQRQALANLRGESAKLREQIVAEQILLKRYGSGLPQKHYTQMQDNIKNAQEKRDAIVQRINEAEKSIGENQTKVTEESGLLVDARTFDLASLLGKIQTKWDTLEEEISSRQSNVSYVISDADINVGVRMVEDQMKEDKRILEEINNKIKAAGSPNLPLVEIPGIGEEGVQQYIEIRDRDYNTTIDPRSRSRSPMKQLDSSLRGDYRQPRNYDEDPFDIDM